MTTHSEALRQGYASLDTLAPSVPALIALATQLELDNNWTTTHLASLQSSLATASLHAKDHDFRFANLGAKGRVSGSPVFTTYSYHSLELLKIWYTQRQATGGNTYGFHGLAGGLDEKYPRLGKIEREAFDRELCKYINDWRDAYTGGARLQASKFKDFYESKDRSLSLPYTRDPAYADRQTDKGLTEVCVKLVFGTEGDWRGWISSRIRQNLIKTVEFPDFFHRRIDDISRYPGVFEEFDSAPQDLQSRILEELVSCFLHHPQGISYSRCFDIQTRLGVLPAPGTAKSVKRDETLLARLFNFREVPVTEHESKRSRLGPNTLNNLETWSTFGGAGGEKPGYRTEIALNDAGLTIARRQLVENRPYAVPSICDGIADSTLFKTIETMLQDLPWYFNIYHLSPQDRKALTRESYNKLISTRQAKLKARSCSNRCCDGCSTKRVPMGLPSDLYESPFASKDPLCLSCAFWAVVMKTDNHTEEDFYLALKFPAYFEDVNFSPPHFTLAAKYNWLIRCLGGCNERRLGQPSSDPTDAKLTSFTLPCVCSLNCMAVQLSGTAHPSSLFGVNVPAQQRIFDRTLPDEKNYERRRIAIPRIPPMTTGKRRTLFCTECSALIQTRPILKGLRVAVPRLTAEDKVICARCRGDANKKTLPTDQELARIVSTITLTSNKPVATINAVARDFRQGEGINLSHLLNCLSDGAKMSRILTLENQVKLSTFLETLTDL